MPQLIFLAAAFFLGWCIRGDYNTCKNIDTYVAEEWTEEDERKFDDSVINYKDTEEYRKWDGVEISTDTEADE